MLLRGEEGGLQQAGGLVEVPFAGEGGEEFPRLADGGGQGVALGGLEGGAGQLLRLLGAVGAGGVEGQVGGGDVDEGARPLVGATPQQGAGVGDGAVAVLPAACGVGDLGEAGVEDGDPYLVLPSADVERAAATAVTARTQNNGQSCIAAKRFIVHTDVYDAFLERFTAGMAALTVGDPMDEATDVGPLASESGRADLEELVADAVGRGASVHCGGRRPEGLDRGWFYEPTVLTGVAPGARIHREEAFGPVAVVYRAGGLDEALDIANDSPFGLSSNVWTRDASEVERCVRDLEAGGVFVNGMTASHPALPFGGVKRSGYGRELSGHGIKEFCNATTVWQAA